MARARILVADPLAEDGLARLREAADVEVRTKLPEAELIEAVGGVDALVVRSETKVTAPVLDAGAALKVVGRAGVGVDNIDVPTATWCRCCGRWSARWRSWTSPRPTDARSPRRRRTSPRRPPARRSRGR